VPEAILVKAERLAHLRGYARADALRWMLSRGARTRSQVLSVALTAEEIGAIVACVATRPLAEDDPTLALLNEAVGKLQDAMPEAGG
jgi:hypothetical protein